jgi:hypothetical protein
MANERSLKTQVGLQAAFETGVAATIVMPRQYDYADEREVHVSDYDSGNWVPTTSVANTASYATIKGKGQAHFEILAVLLNSGWADVVPSGTDPWTHTYTISPTTPGAPKPLTFEIGSVGTNIGATGPAVRLIDQCLQKLTLSANINDKWVSAEDEWFGVSVDDNSGAGYAFTAALVVPANLEGMNGLLGQIGIQDAAATGGDFATMTAFSCAIVDWSLAMDTGLQPLWCLCDNQTTFSGYKQVEPNVELDMTIRTSQTNYGLVKAKKDALTYQELQLKVNGSSGRAATFNLTGRWTECASAHVRENGEVVMKAKFRCETPAMQTVTPHYFAAIIVSKHGWT